MNLFLRTPSPKLFSLTICCIFKTRRNRNI